MKTVPGELKRSGTREGNPCWKERKLRERDAAEKSRLNRVKASPEDREKTYVPRAHPSRAPPRAHGALRTGAPCEKLARKDANTLRMDSSATVKVRLRKGAARWRRQRPFGRGGPSQPFAKEYCVAVGR